MHGTDEIDAIAGKRESAQREMERRIVAQMLTCMDDLASPRPAKRTKPNDAVPAVTADRHVLVIGEALQNGSLIRVAVDLHGFLQHGALCVSI